MRRISTKEIIPQGQLLQNKNSWVGIGCLVVTAIILVTSWVQLPPLVPLFYSKPWGAQQLAQPLFLLLPLALSFAFLVLNFSLAKSLPEESFLKKALILGANTIAVLASITIIRIIFLIS